MTAPQTPTPASGSDGLETVKWQYRTAAHRQWHDCQAEHAGHEKSIGSDVRALVTREAAEKERAGRLAAESQVAALKAALDEIASGTYTRGDHRLIARQALAIKEGR